MYSDEEQLDRYRKTWLTKDVYKIVKKEQSRLKKEEGRDLSMQKIINNVIQEKYGKT